MSKSRTFGYSMNYQSSKNVLERQTAALLAERKQIQNIYPNRQESKSPITNTNREVTSLTPIVHQGQRKEDKTQEVVNKLQQIIRLCKHEGELSHEEMREVVKVETQVLNYLKKANVQPAHQAMAPISSSQQVIKSKSELPPSFASNPQMNQTWGRMKYNNQILSEDTLQIIGALERKALGEIVHLQQERDTIKRQKQQLIVQVQRLRSEFMRVNAGEASVPRQQSSNMNNQHVNQLGEENRVLKEENRMLKMNGGQVQKLRQQNNALKQENQYLNSRLEAAGNMASLQTRQTVKIEHKQPQGYSSKPQGLAYGQIDSQIAVYENQLKRATVVINQLKQRLVNVPGLQQLHYQGQRIRVETAQILRIKSNAGGFQSNQAHVIIKELQQKLDQEERGKAVFFEELRAFKQRYLDLQQENKVLKKSKVSFDPVPRPLGSTARNESYSPRGGIIKKKGGSLGDYQQTLNDLKHILY